MFHHPGQFDSARRRRLAKARRLAAKGKVRVDQADVRIGRLQLLERLAPALRLGGDDDVVGAFQGLPDAAAKKRLLIRDEHADGFRLSVRRCHAGVSPWAWPPRRARWPST